MVPRRVIIVPGYGWHVTIKEASLYDIEELQKLLTNETAFTEKIMSFVLDWDCPDSQNKPLPLTVEGLKRLPQSAIRYIIGCLREPFQDDDLKNASEQSHISEPKAAESPPGVPA